MKRQRITLKNLQLYLANDKANYRLNSVSIPPAQSKTLLHAIPLDIDRLSQLGYSVCINSSLPIVLRAVIELQLLYGLRISECLNISILDVSKSGHIRIKGAKGSENRVVLPQLYKSFWLNASPSVLPICTTYSRFWFYRQYKNLGLYAIFGNSKVASVTHLFRHLVNLNLQNSFSDLQLNQKFIGHKSIKSTQYYVKPKKTK